MLGIYLRLEHAHTVISVIAVYIAVPVPENIEAEALLAVYCLCGQSHRSAVTVEHLYIRGRYALGTLYLHEQIRIVYASCLFLLIETYPEVVPCVPVIKVLSLIGCDLAARYGHLQIIMLGEVFKIKAVGRSLLTVEFQHGNAVLRIALHGDTRLRISVAVSDGVTVTVHLDVVSVAVLVKSVPVLGEIILTVEKKSVSGILLVRGYDTVQLTAFHAGISAL